MVILVCLLRRWLTCTHTHTGAFSHWSKVFGFEDFVESLTVEVGKAAFTPNAASRATSFHSKSAGRRFVGRPIAKQSLSVCRFLRVSCRINVFFFFFLECSTLIFAISIKCEGHRLGEDCVTKVWFSMSYMQVGHMVQIVLCLVCFAFVYLEWEPLVWLENSTCLLPRTSFWLCQEHCGWMRGRGKERCHWRSGPSIKRKFYTLYRSCVIYILFLNTFSLIYRTLIIAFYIWNISIFLLALATNKFFRRTTQWLKMTPFAFFYTLDNHKLTCFPLRRNLRPTAAIMSVSRKLCSDLTQGRKNRECLWRQTRLAPVETT